MLVGFVLGLLVGGGLAVAVAVRWSRRSAERACTCAAGRTPPRSSWPRWSSGPGAGRALDLVGEGIIVVDVNGRRLFTNAAAGLLTDAPHEEALVAAAVDAALTEASRPDRGAERGPVRPPTRHVTVAASPLGRAVPGLARWCWSATSPACAASRPFARSSWPT